MGKSGRGKRRAPAGSAVIASFIGRREPIFHR
jgi:hypothetical protein